MTDPGLYVPADAVGLVRVFLADRVPAKFPGVRVAANLSPRWTPTSLPELVLFDDSGPMNWPVETQPQIRGTVWADGHTTAHSIAGYALGLLLCRRVPGIAKILPGTALLEARDDSNGGLMCSFTVRTRVRTVPAT
ncbi:hypothetical protein [Nocardia salmonicida]|uniref:hypothetical protein n=1 Tax=Nocardia salmonicida TaxID=53431 RepID=UPI002E2CD097|nr:hypothetical protein [Nocardia salmonicida]